MAYKLNCKDFGSDCDYVAKGETVDDLLANCTKHVKEVHGFTDEQLNDPEMIEKAKSLIQEV